MYNDAEADRASSITAPAFVAVASANASPRQGTLSRTAAADNSSSFCRRLRVRDYGREAAVPRAP